MADDGVGLTEETQKLMSIGVGIKVAKRVGEIFSIGALLPEQLDDRALEALKEFNEEGALEVLNQFAKSDLSHVQNKSAFLCGIMKTYREKNRMKRDGQDPSAGLNGPDEAKIKSLLERTGYTLDITTGQRKYGGPPPGWEGPPPGTGSEVKNESFRTQFRLQRAKLSNRLVLSTDACVTDSEIQRNK